MTRVIAALLVLATALTACSSTPETGPKAGTLRVLAGSELADLEPILERAAEATGVRVEFTFTGTLEGAETLARGESEFDAVWFSANRYVQAVPAAATRLASQVKIMGSPVVLGLSTSKAAELGWADKPVTWADIAAAAGAKKFTYGMTDPSSSNSGFSALVGVASALAGSGNAIDAAQIEQITPDLKRFFSAQVLSSGSSGWLSTAYTQQAGRIDGLINYESVLLSMNAAGTLPEPLTIIRPSDGVVTADYPITLLTGAPDAVRADFERLSAHLLTPYVQRAIVADTFRRPVIPGVEVPATFGTGALIELPFPATAAAFDALLSAYFDRIRRPSRTLYVVDTSGSMAGERIESLRAALIGLTGVDDDLIGRYRRFRGREEVTLLPFNGSPGTAATFTVPETAPEAELGRIRSFVEGLNASGGTAIYDSLAAAYRAVGPVGDRFTSIVLMTDGSNTGGQSLADFTATHAALPPELRGVPVFPIVFGESKRSEMDQVAAMTGGRLFDARESDLADVFREIRGYQ